MNSIQPGPTPKYQRPDESKRNNQEVRKQVDSMQSKHDFGPIISRPNYVYYKCLYKYYYYKLCNYSAIKILLIIII